MKEDIFYMKNTIRVIENNIIDQMHTVEYKAVAFPFGLDHA